MPDDAEWSDRLNALVAAANLKDDAARDAIADLVVVRQRLDRLISGQISSSPRLLMEFAAGIDRCIARLEFEHGPEDPPYLSHAPGPDDPVS